MNYTNKNMFTKPLKKVILRGNDPTGHGYYGAKRGNRKHKGLDLKSEKKEDVFSLIDGVVTKIGFPYANNLTFRYVEITNDIYRIRVMYIFPKNISVGDRIFKGDLIGQAQDISSYWNSKMINHIHIEVYKNGLITDPEPLIV